MYWHGLLLEYKFPGIDSYPQILLSWSMEKRIWKLNNAQRIMAWMCDVQSIEITKLHMHHMTMEMGNARTLADQCRFNDVSSFRSCLSGQVLLCVLCHAMDWLRFQSILGAFVASIALVSKTFRSHFSSSWILFCRLMQLITVGTLVHWHVSMESGGICGTLQCMP